MKDKILFWMDGALTHFCLAFYLQKKYYAQYYAIIDTISKPKKFFKEQKFVEFQKTWFLHDHVKELKSVDIDYLAVFEKKYGISLWELAVNERIFYRFNRLYKFTTNEILSILEKECKLFEEILDEIKPDFFITKEPALHHHEILYRLCKVKGIKILILNNPNIGKCVISQEVRKVDGINDIQSTSIKNLNFDQLREYRESFTMYNKISEYRKNFLTSRSALVKAAINFFISNNQQIKTQYSYYGRTKFRVIKDSMNILLSKKIRKRFIDKNLLKQIKTKEKFIYFPLGVDQERNLLISAPLYTNQVEVIRQIVKSMPVDYKLYVKENPAQEIRRWREINEYREIADIPNIRLFHPDFPTEELYKNCSLVITIGGSSGFEAAFYQKPSIIFSDLGYSWLPSVYKMNSLNELPNAIRLSLQKTVLATDLERYVTFLDNISFNFDLQGFETKYNNYFYFGGHLLNVDIAPQKMEQFLKDNIETLDELAEEYVKKLKL